ncbi:MAG: AAA family ATPase [Candidatus Margulisiibacteriota bacterium]
MLLNCELTIKTLVKLHQNSYRSINNALVTALDLCLIIKKALNSSQISWLVPESLEWEDKNKKVSINIKNNAANSNNTYFIAPEINLNDKKKINEIAVLYSLGILLTHLNTSPENWYEIHLMPYKISSKIQDETLKNITRKLLKRDREERYQSFNSLIYDLQTALEKLKTNGEIKNLDIGKKDKLAKFNLTKFLYGRHKEIKTLTNALTKKNSNKIIISGASGIGKTYLIDKVIQQFQGSHSLIKIKFDQSKESAKGIDTLINEITKIALSTESLKNINKNMIYYNEIINTNHHSIIDQIQIIANMINIVSKQKKLILYLDDIQWMNPDSKNMIFKMISHCENTTLIATTRESIETYVDDYKSKKETEDYTESYFITIGPLEEKYVIESFIDLFCLNEDKVKHLAKELHKKTHGNPLHIKEALLRFIENKEIWYDTSELKWEWNIKIIKESQVTENVAKILIEKISSIPKETQLILHYGALIGSEFNSKLISKILNKDLITVELALWHAVNKEIIFENTPNQTNEYKFTHDKVQLACINLNGINSEESNMHIGKKMLKMYRNQDSEIELESVINHLNKGINFLNQKEIYALIVLNYTHGLEMLNKMFGKSANTFFSKAISILTTKLESNAPTALFNLYIKKLNALQMSNNFKEAQEIIVKTNKAFPLSRIKNKLTLTKVQLLSTQSRYTDVLSLSQKILKSRNIVYDIIPTKNQCIRELIKVSLKLILNYNKLLKNPSQQSNSFLPQLYYEMVGPSFFVNKYSYIYIICKSLNHSLSHGSTKETSFFLMLFSKIILIKFPKYHLIKNLIQKSVKISNTFKSEKIQLNTNLIYNIFFSRFYVTIQQNIKEFKENIKLSKKNTDIIFVSYAITTCPSFIIAEGKSLSEAKIFVNQNNKFVHEFKYKDVIYSMKVFKWFIETIQEDTESDFNLNDIQTSIQKNKLLIPNSILICLQIQVYFIRKEFSKARMTINSNKNSFDEIIGLIQLEELKLFATCSILEDSLDSTKDLNPFEIQFIQETMANYRTYAQQAPHNYLCKYLLIKGSYYRYKLMLDEANKCHRHLYQALAHEKLASLINESELSQYHFIESEKFYSMWKKNN